MNDANFNTNGTLLISGSSDMSLKLWNLQDEYRCIRTFNGHDHTVSGVTFTTDNLRVISCSRDGNVKIWNIDNGYCENSLRPHDGEWVKRVIVSRDISYMATCSVDQVLSLCLFVCVCVSCLLCVGGCLNNSKPQKYEMII